MILLHDLAFIDLVDILVVSLILYRLLRYGREGMGLRVAGGVAGATAFYLVSRLLGFPLLSWLLHNLLRSLPLLLVVIFQPDIRRMLITLASGKQEEQPVEEVPETIREIVTAAGALAEKRIGALIVVERTMALKPFIETGTEIDAKVTSELISSIFLPYSPIHDGAVIVRRGKIAHAGCFLPLTRNPMVSKNLGTRHRAALGLTELADPVVVVVSEETGGISLVVDGHITSGLELETLRKVLMRLLVEAT